MYDEYGAPKQMTQEQYVTARGLECPYCHSPDLTGESIDVNGGTATQEVFCGNCERDWLDTYKLTGYTDV